MARIQVVPLPPVTAGEYTHTPFIIVLDQLDLDTEHWSDAELEHLKEATGAALVLAHEATLDAPGGLTLTDEQRTELLDRLTLTLDGAQ
jgi:hypothetical protein